MTLNQRLQTSLLYNNYNKQLLYSDLTFITCDDLTALKYYLIELINRINAIDLLQVTSDQPRLRVKQLKCTIQLQNYPILSSSPFNFIGTELDDFFFWLN